MPSRELSIQKSNTKSPNPPSIEALAAAALWAEGKSQVDIAAVLKKSQSAVSRLLRESAAHVKVRREFRWDDLDPQTAAAVRLKTSARGTSERVAILAHSLGHKAPVVHAVPCGADTLGRGEQFEIFAAAAAPIVRGLLEGVRGRVGVAWGSTLWYLTQSLRAILPQKPIRSLAPIEFVPLCGDPLADSQERYADRTSSRIVADLSRAVNGDSIQPPWLGLVPAFIPKDFDEAEAAVINRLIEMVPQYTAIFGPRTGKRGKGRQRQATDDLSMVLTAAGPSERPLGFGENPLFGLTQSETTKLSSSIVGDIGGVLIPREAPIASSPRRKKQSDTLVDQLTMRWTGLKLDHLKECAGMAATANSPSRPGVTLICFGSPRAEIVVEAIRRGLVNVLIIGSDLEAALDAHLPPLPIK